MGLVTLNHNKWLIKLSMIALNQRFSTWGTHTPGVTQAVLRGYATNSEGISKIIKNHLKEDYMGIMFDQGVRKRGPILIWGYTERYNFDLGVRKYQKVENPCIKRLPLYLKFD
jgi:hypothetical protein